MGREEAVGLGSMRALATERTMVCCGDEAAIRLVAENGRIKKSKRSLL